jgi:hypothetical protein
MPKLKGLSILMHGTPYHLSLETRSFRYTHGAGFCKAKGTPQSASHHVLRLLSLTIPWPPFYLNTL